MAKRRLGRGLDGLLPSAPASASQGDTKGFVARIEELHPNRDQPRTQFREEALDELAASIRELGVLEPILVRKRANGGFEIVAGERRWRASQRAGLKEVPVFVRELSTEKAFEAALVENLQREDLNPLETARAFQRLVEEFGLNQQTIAERVGKNRTTVANALRLLKLPDVIRGMLEEGRLKEGQARALLGAPDVPKMKALAHRAVAESWSVRETERQVKRASLEAGARPKAAAKKSANVLDLESRLSKQLGAVATVADRNGKGRIEIRYTSYDELDRILGQLMAGRG